jgi:hypothetical protein
MKNELLADGSVIQTTEYRRQRAKKAQRVEGVGSLKTVEIVEGV